MWTRVSMRTPVAPLLRKRGRGERGWPESSLHEVAGSVSGRGRPNPDRH